MLSMESSLFFNNKGEKSPSHKEQKEIAEGFKEMNTAKLNMVSMAVDGMLIWTKQSSSTECIQLNWTEMMVLMTGCNHRCKFMQEDVRHPGITSYYLTFSTSVLGCKWEQEESNISLQGNTLIGDNA